MKYFSYKPLTFYILTLVLLSCANKRKSDHNQLVKDDAALETEDSILYADAKVIEEIHNNWLVGEDTAHLFPQEKHHQDIEKHHQMLIRRLDSLLIVHRALTLKYRVMVETNLNGKESVAQMEKEHQMMMSEHLIMKADHRQIINDFEQMKKDHEKMQEDHLEN
ncbi:MAG TPA: hypothetical protein VGC01_07120 [Mucilaginibacter sp.]